MKKKWGKGDPVNLSDLLRITPVANEIIQLSEELELSSTDVMWIVAQIIDNGEEIDARDYARLMNEIEMPGDEEWDDIDADSLESGIQQAMYMVDVKVSSGGRFPEVGFKAGINEKEDIAYFFDMVLDMLEKLE